MTEFWDKSQSENDTVCENEWNRRIARIMLHALAKVKDIYKNPLRWLFSIFIRNFEKDAANI